MRSLNTKKKLVLSSHHPEIGSWEGAISPGSHQGRLSGGLWESCPSPLSLFFFFLSVLGLPQSSRALWLRCKGLIAQRHVGPQFPNLNQLPLGRRILNHWTPREIPSPSFLNTLSLFMPFPPPEMPFPPTLLSKLLVIFKAPVQHSPPLQILPWLPYVVISPSHSSWFIPYM